MTARVAILGFALCACTASGGADAQAAAMDVPASRDAPLSEPDSLVVATCTDAAPPAADPPTVACGPGFMTTLGYDPCLHYVDCGGWTYGTWMATYVNGTCTAGSCVFTEPPIFECCTYGCLGSGGQSRCARLPPGASTAP